MHRLGEQTDIPLYATYPPRAFPAVPSSATTRNEPMANSSPTTFTARAIPPTLGPMIHG